MVLLLALSALTACNAGGGNETETSGGDVPPEQSSAEETTAEVVTTESPDELLISAEALSQYVIIYPEKATAEEKEQALILQMAIESAFGVSLEFRDDFVREGTGFTESEYEILVGRCARSEARAFCADFRTDDYGYGMVEKKLVLAGASANGTVAAVTAFIENGLGNGENFFLNENRTVVRGTYGVGEVILNGVPLASYVVVYPNGDSSLRNAAEYLATRLSNEYSYVLECMSDENPVCAHEILIGETNRDTSAAKDETLGENDYLLATVGDSVWMMGLSPTMIYRAIEGLSKSFAADGDAVRLDLSVPVKITCETSNLRAMTFNIRCAEYTDERIDLVFRMIDLYAPDTIGFQEATVKWMGMLKTRLGDRYGCVGVGREANLAGEASPVFYLKSKFELIDSGTKWMTETPDVPGSKVPESSLPRVFSYAVLKVKATEQVFVHVNTHLEHTSEKAREIQAGHLLKFLETYRETGMTYIVSGDFNCAKGAGSYSLMTNSGLRDALSIADEAVRGATYHGYGKTETVIDHIFVSGGVEVSYYKACTETFPSASGGIAYPSDHNPVIIDYVIR